MSPSDTQVCHECQICSRFHRILKVILEMDFSAHCTQIWKFNRISLTVLLAKLHKDAFDAAAGSNDAWRLPTELAGGGILCSGAWNHGQDSFVYTSGHCRRWRSRMEVKIMAGSLFVHCKMHIFTRWQQRSDSEKWLVSLPNFLTMRKTPLSISC